VRLLTSPVLAVPERAVYVLEPAELAAQHPLGLQALQRRFPRVRLSSSRPHALTS
jgi:hypothetical protein